MAKLYISEYRLLGSGVVDRTQVAKEPSLATQAVTFSTATQSAAFSATTTLVRVHTDEACSISFGTNPTATTDSMRMIAGQTEYFAVTPGHKVSAISNS